MKFAQNLKKQRFVDFDSARYDKKYKKPNYRGSCKNTTLWFDKLTMNGNHK